MGWCGHCSLQYKNIKNNWILIKWMIELIKQLFVINNKEEVSLELKGQVEEIIYQNEVNSYTIAVLSLQEDLITIVGYLPFVNVRRLSKSYR